MSTRAAAAVINLPPRELVLRWGPLEGTEQVSYFDDDTPEAQLLLCGGYSSGKTITLTAKALKLSTINAPVPGIWVVPDYAHIFDTILPTLTSIDPSCGEPWFLTPSQFHFHQTRHALAWEGGGSILFLTAENPDSIAGPNVAWAAIDEPGKIAHAAWRNTVARVRHPSAKLRQVVCAGTPEGLNWLADVFGPDRAPNCHVHTIATRENTELLKYHPGYLDQVRANATDAEIASYLGGQFVNLTGALAYPMFSADLHWREGIEPVRGLPLRISFDFNVDPMASVIGQIVAGVNGPELRIIDALSLYASTVQQVCAALVERYPSWPAGVCVYGDATGRARSHQSLRSNYDVIRELLGAIGPVTLCVPTANPSVSMRLNAVNRLLQDARGVVRLWIAKSEPVKQCPTRDVIRSLQQTVRKPGTDDIWKKPGETVTHHGDALGYLIAAEFPALVPVRFDANRFVKLQDW